MHYLVKASLRALLVVACSASAVFAADLSGKLRITAQMADPAPRKVIESLVAGFEELHPNVDVELTIVDIEAWKTQIRNALGANPPDVVTWFAANRMGPYVDAGLFEDISDMYANGDLPGLDSVKGAVTIDGKQWGVPYTYYPWGIYYRADIFNELGLKEPATFDEELANCKAIIASGRACYAIGTKFPWTAGGWFDYLDMRTNGFDFHMALGRGEIAWTDPRVRETFANWRKLIDIGGFVANHQSYTFQEGLAFMTEGKAASYLLGNFIVGALRDAGLKDDQIDFYQFPKIADFPQGEDAPTDTLHIASGAANKENARAFLQYVTSADVQTKINSSDGLGAFPVNSASSVGDDKFLKQGFDMLTNNAKGGLAQFFDRDFPAEMAAAGMEGFQEFMVFPDNLDDILNRLEEARQRIYK
jgi:multiple sugar transport system substrate-binding protein